jgi:hypothetical protein
MTDKVLATELVSKGVSPAAKRHAELHNHHRLEYQKHRSAYQSAPSGSQAEQFHREKTLHNQNMMNHHAKLYQKEITGDNSVAKQRVVKAPAYKSSTKYISLKRHTGMPIISSVQEINKTEQMLASFVEAASQSYDDLAKYHAAEAFKHKEQYFPSDKPSAKKRLAY